MSVIIDDVQELLCARRVRLMSAGESHGDDAWKLLEEKEKDLEIAARIGQSLLELNRELKTRNDFLEESLNASNETIVQLRHELQLRTNLLHAYVENEDELDAHSKESVDGLQWKVKKLENENENLRAEAINLKKLSSGLEETERLHISECSRNLDLANEKISHLKALLSEKGAECAAQNAEVERLLKVVAAQSAREKTLVTENTDLREQIDETMTIYDELSKDYADLQEKYTEVLSMLHDADEELKTVRRSMSRNRNGSVDSLYDSLASELETSDSGLCSVLNCSHEVKKSNESMKRFPCLQLELEDACVIESQKGQMASEPLFADLPVRNIALKGKRNGEHFMPFLGESRSSLLCCSSDTQPSTSNFFEGSKLSLQTAPCQFKKKESNDACSTFCCGTDELLKSGSSDSLESYEGPKFGEPGKPGTRDLDFSLRKRGIRKEIEQEYARFRLQRGLSPLNLSFFSVPSTEKFMRRKQLRAESVDGGFEASNSTRVDLLSKWKCIASKGLVEPLDGNILERTVVSRASFRDLHRPDKNISMLTRNQTHSNSADHRFIQYPSDVLKGLGICNISRSFLPRYDKFSSHCLRRSDSSSLVGSLSSCDFPLKQFSSGIITRMRPST